MLQRCQNPKSPLRKWYLDKGIRVCAAWEQFETFFEDLGPAFPGAYLDRLDNSLDYAPGNVRWATRRQSMTNRTFKKTQYPTGIRKTRAGYQARITIYGREYTVGSFQTIDDAVQARRLWETTYAD